MTRVGTRAGLCVCVLAAAACGDSGDPSTTDAQPTITTLPTTLPPTSSSPGTDGTTGGSMTDPTMTGATDSGVGTTNGPGGSSTSNDPTTGSPTESDTTEPPACAPEDCEAGEFCNMGTGECEPGCDEEEDCQGETVCDLDANVCTGCVYDGDCALGTVCEGGACVPGCNDQQPCQDGLSCCADTCVDALTDPLNCGGCDNACPDPGNTVPSCADGMCGFDCADGFDNCDGDPGNGCENQGACLCTPGEAQDCYTGLPQTEGVGECKAGSQTCNQDGTGWGPCEGEVLPLGADICANNKDDNCDGMVDEDPDGDNDGYTVCGGDCCDAVGPNCQNPELVNPGAFEVDGNDVDDDCDGTKDNPLPLCDQGIASNSGNPLDYAKAIDLCQFTTENAQGEDKIWGVISGGLHLASGAGAPNANSRSVRPGFGSNISPSLGQRLAVMSTGHAADSNDSNPGFAQYQDGQSMGTSSTFPADWYSLNGNQLPNAPGCPNVAGNQANDPVLLKLRIRVPTNANSFSAKMFFFSAEYPEYVCTAFNDFFVTLVDSSDNENPTDKNIAIYTQGNNDYPVGVNILKAANGLFTQCTNGQITQCGVPATYNGCQGTSLLNGTGFDITGSTLFSCNYAGRHGGGTGWLTMSGNVTPGETMEIRFAIWDSSDGLFDSTVLLDHWEWSVQASEPGIEPG